MKRVLAFVFVLVLLGGLIGGVSYFQFMVKPQMIKTIIGGMKPPAAGVAVAQVQSENWTRRVPAIGTMKAVQGIDVAPQVGGVVSAIRFQSGQEVAKGTLLVEIDPSTEQADLKSGLAQMKNADLALSRQQELVSGGNTSRSSVDAAQATRDIAAASVERAKAVIAQKTLLAPFAGRLGIRKIDVGQYVSPGTAMVTLTQLDPIYVDFPIPEQGLASLAAGQQVEAKVDGYPDETFKGTIRTIDTRVSQDSRSATVRAEIDNPGRKLLPGMFAGISVVSGEPRSVVTVPKTGVTFSLYGDSVYVVRAAKPDAPAGSAEAATPDGTPAAPLDPNADLVVERRFVKTGETRGDRLEVKEGLKAGDTVVTQGQIKLMPGAHVKIDANGGLPARSPLPLQ